jgi:hypothetical protein
MLKRFSLCLIFLSLLSSILQAAEAVPETSALDPSCACVARGKRWAQGEEACIAGLRMVCGMNQNISAWQSLGLSCQVSSRFREKAFLTPM